MNRNAAALAQEIADRKRADAALRDRIKFLFSNNAEVRADAQEALKEAWAFDLPSFDMDELREMPHDNCVTVAAKRDGHKQIITWLCKL